MIVVNEHYGISIYKNSLSISFQSLVPGGFES